MIDTLVQRADAENIRVLRVNPTGKLSSNSLRLAKVRNATVHAEFGFPGAELKTHVGMYPVWIVGEVGMMNADLVQHIWNHWDALNRRPLLIFEGYLKVR